MSWAERFLLFSLIAANLAATLWTLLRACQVWHEIKPRDPLDK